jgi:hypothetical protein
MALKDSVEKFNQKLKETNTNVKETNKKMAEEREKFRTDFITFVTTVLKPKMQNISSHFDANGIAKNLITDKKKNGANPIFSYAFKITAFGNKIFQIDFIGNLDHKKVFVHRYYSAVPRITKQVPDTEIKEVALNIGDLTEDKIDGLVDELFKQTISG